MNFTAINPGRGPRFGHAPEPERTPLTTAAALASSLVVPVAGYAYLGALYAELFLIGYFGGFVLWLTAPTTTTWRSVRWPFWLTMGAFLALHKVEENRTRFFEVMSEKVTGLPVPQVSFGLVLTLLVLPVGGWLAVPVLMKRGVAFGSYLASTFFVSMGVTELAHFAMPLFSFGPYGYFPRHGQRRAAGAARLVGAVAPHAWLRLRRRVAAATGRIVALARSRHRQLSCGSGSVF